MFKFDHFGINIDESYQKDEWIINEIRSAGFPYEPRWGKGTRGFKVSNLWIGNEYFEMINILKSEGGGWKREWVEKYNKGHRGLICIMLDVDNIDNLYNNFNKKSIGITKPEYLSFKWFFNIFTRTMPWKNSYLNFFEGIPLQIGFQQMKDESSRKFMEEYMVPNSKDNGIIGIRKVIVRGSLSSNDENLIKDTFDSYITDTNPITIELNKDQILIFEISEKYNVEIIENVNVWNFKN